MIEDDLPLVNCVLGERRNTFGRPFRRRHEAVEGIEYLVKNLIWKEGVGGLCKDEKEEDAEEVEGKYLRDNHVLDTKAK